MPPHLPSSTCFQWPTLRVRINDWLLDPWHRAAHLSSCVGANNFPLPPSSPEERQDLSPQDSWKAVGHVLIWVALAFI